MTYTSGKNSLHTHTHTHTHLRIQESCGRHLPLEAIFHVCVILIHKVSLCLIVISADGPVATWSSLELRFSLTDHLYQVDPIVGQLRSMAPADDSIVHRFSPPSDPCGGALARAERSTGRGEMRMPVPNATSVHQKGGCNDGYTL